MGLRRKSDASAMFRAEPPAAADALQRPLRSRFRARLTASVRRLTTMKSYESIVSGMKMAEDNGVCFVCGTLGVDSRDHVIPTCLFVPPLPDNLLTLPAHHRCHN